MVQSLSSHNIVNTRDHVSGRNPGIGRRLYSVRPIVRRPIVNRKRIQVVEGYFRPKPKLYAYLQQVPVKRQYDVAYPYGVGGDTPLDQLAGTVNFDNWVTTAIIGYFLNRYVA